jgi:hypothetical protein
MADLYSIRRHNLRALIAKHGNGEVAKAAGYPSPSYLSQMVGKKAKRGITERSARRIETAMLLPLHWFDTERDDYGNAVNSSNTAKTPPVEIPTPGRPEPLGIINPEHFTESAYIVCAAMAKLNIQIPKSKFPTVVGMVINSPDQTEDGLQKLAEQLVMLSS